MKIQFASHKKVLISIFVLINIYSYCNGQITNFSLQQSYIGVRTPTRTVNQSYYEFWDSNVGWAGIYCGNIVSIGNLSVTGDIKVNNQWFREYHNNSIGIGNGTNGSALYLKALSIGYNYGTLETKLSNTSDLYVAGNVGIGVTDTKGYKLAVDGAINAKEVKITATVPSSDYVFDQTYKLKALPDVEKFINDNKHLPEVPSAADFKANGYSVGEMDDLLLRKVEELTLYMIEQNKLVQSQNELIKLQEERIKALEASLKDNKK